MFRIVMKEVIELFSLKYNDFGEYQNEFLLRKPIEAYNKFLCRYPFINSLITTCPKSMQKGNFVVIESLSFLSLQGRCFSIFFPLLFVESFALKWVIKKSYLYAIWV